LPAPKVAADELLPAWLNEPTDISSLQDRYYVEAKIVGREPGTTLFVVQARDRSGKLDACSSPITLFFSLVFLQSLA